MSKVGPKGRSYQAIFPNDLTRLLQIATQDQTAFFKEYPDWGKLYRRRKICIALCQGAALHYVNGATGINDFDVYTFYKKHPARNWYAKRNKPYDFGDPKFGQSVDKPDYIGRRVDCLARGIDVKTGEDPAAAIRRYLKAGRTETARLLALKAVVLLEPDCGEIIWP